MVAACSVVIMTLHHSEATDPSVESGTNNRAFGSENGAMFGAER